MSQTERLNPSARCMCVSKSWPGVSELGKCLMGVAGRDVCNMIAIPRKCLNNHKTETFLHLDPECLWGAGQWKHGNCDVYSSYDEDQVSSRLGSKSRIEGCELHLRCQSSSQLADLDVRWLDRIQSSTIVSLEHEEATGMSCNSCQ